MNTNQMTQTHIEHPEDEILIGNLDAISALYADANVSMKMDGMSLVWGTNPNNGQFFVCTKAAFNKKKIRLCYTTEDIDVHFGHQEEVAEILYYCLKYLPRTDNIYWGDWLGFGRSQTVQQNTLTYMWNDVVSQKLIIAPHTQVHLTQDGLFCNAVCKALTEIFDPSSIILWVQPCVDRVKANVEVPDIDTSKVQFLNKKEATEAKKKINALIREGIELTDARLFDILGCIYLTNLYQMVIEMKEEVMDSMIINDAPMCFVYDDVQVDCEGFVLETVYGMFKLVDRPMFAHANFNSGKFA